MTKTHKLLSIAALFAAGALTISCNSLKEQLDTPEEVPAIGKTVTLTATVGLDVTTKALDATGAKTFAVGDQIAVIYTQEGGTTVKAVSNALTTTDIREEGQKADITVTLDTPAEDGTVRYIYPASMALTTIDPADPIDDAHTIDFTQLSAQDGTLATLAGSYDLAVFDGALNGLELPANALLSNLLAIGEFTVKNSGGDNITNTVTGLKVTDGTNTYTVSRAAADGPVYVAMLPVVNTQELTFTATDGTYTYTRSITGKALAKNNMYPVNLKMNRIVDLDKVTTTDGNDVKFLAAVDKDIISGNFDGGYGYITISPGATVALDGVNIVLPDDCDHAAIHCLGNANIVLADGSDNDIVVNPGSYPAVFVPQGSTLTISGSGGLSANGYNGTGAGIGGGYIYSTSTSINCGTIVIAGGVIEATGNQVSAGIGSGLNSSCDGIRITGGVIKSATGGDFAAGIGCGDNGSCGNIEISGGQIGGDYGGWWHDGACGGNFAAGIGGGRDGTCGDITIGAGITFIRAQKGGNAHDFIGLGASGTCGAVTIGSGLTVEYMGWEMHIHPTAP